MPATRISELQAHIPEQRSRGGKSKDIGFKFGRNVESLYTRILKMA